MKNTGVVILFLSLLFLVASFNASEQFGWASEPSSTMKLRSDLLENEELYKLVFPTVYEGKRSYKPTEAREEDRAVNSRIANFIEQLNKAGDQGYRLISSATSFPLAVVKLDKGRYEYAWFETVSSYFYCASASSTDFVQRYDEFAKRGFDVVDSVISGESMWTASPGEDVCTTRTLFLLEKEKGLEKAKQYVLVPWNNTNEISIKMTPQLARGYYPRMAISKFGILVEPTDETNPGVSDESSLKVVTSGARDNIEKKVNELAKQGYRLALVKNGIAVMSKSLTPVSHAYVWLDAKKRDFEKQLAELEAQGAAYRMTYPNKDGVDNELIFELRANNHDRRREYKVLKLELQEVEAPGGKKVRIDLSLSSKETVKTLNTLTRDGFMVRDLFVSNKVSVLLER
jgi:hypothetical protein